MAGHPGWTAAMVLHGLRLAFAAQPRFNEPPASVTFIRDRAREVLGPDSLDYSAVVLRTGPARGLSIREMVRERFGWRHSRSELYRRSHNGALRVAVVFNGDGVPVPAALLRAGTCQ
jgi:hypothetical protein